MSVALAPVEIEFDEASHTYKANGVDVAGVTTVIGKVTPKELSWWGMQIGIQACCKLFDLGDPKVVEDAVKMRKLTVNDVRDGRASSGSAIHNGLEQYAKHGTIPNLGDYPEVDHPRVAGLAQFLVDAQPEVECSEKKVAYPEYGFAGTFDLIARIDAKKLPVKTWYRKLVEEEFDGRGLFDLKTSKRVYPVSHFPQLAAYDAAQVRMGGEPTDFQAVIHLPANGGYWVRRSTATFDHFVAYRAAYQAQLEIEGKA